MAVARGRPVAVAQSAYRALTRALAEQPMRVSARVLAIGTSTAVATDVDRGRVLSCVNGITLVLVLEYTAGPLVDDRHRKGTAASRTHPGRGPPNTATEPEELWKHRRLSLA